VCSDQAAVTTHHFKVTSETALGCTLQEAANEFDSRLAVDYKAILSDQATYRGVQAYVNQLPLPAPAVAAFSSGIGTGGAIGNATQVCGITSWLTDFAGPGFRGRSYWPFPATSADSVNPTPNPTYLASLATLVTQMTGAITITGSAGSSTMFLWLRQGKNKAGIVQPGQFITGNVNQPKWATQKRRGLGYGRANASPI
jgi:hypothetical protein